ncbi:UNVERIFIED_CONTAM: hypothetical protein FKN15_001948 [Acipenser sinensis]
MKSSIINIEMIRSQEFEQGYKLTLALLLLLLHPVLGFRALLNEVCYKVYGKAELKELLITA